MSSKCFRIVLLLTLVFLLVQGAASFFVKHVQTGLCINDTRLLQSNNPAWGNLSHVELANNCLDPAAQFRFRDNGAMLNLKRRGCLGSRFMAGSGYYLNTFYIYVDAISLDRSGCAQRPEKNFYRAITQTSWGGLSVYYSGFPGFTNRRGGLRPAKPFRIWCAVPKTYQPLAHNYGIDPYLGLTRDCTDAEKKRFNFGSVTCHGNRIQNANCPKDQYMVVKTASFRGLSGTKTCGLTLDYSCEVDVTCLLKKQCDGQHECSIPVDDNLFSGEPCRGLTKYLYFEYKCINTVKIFNGACAPSGPPLNVRTASRSTSSLTFAWDPPLKCQQNDVVTSYTACVSYSENGPCFKTYTTYITTEREWLVRNLNSSTKYYVRVLASIKSGSGFYSQSKGFFTNGRAGKKATIRTARTLTFPLEIPSKTYVYYCVVVLKLKDGKEPKSFASYENNELVTYAEAEKSIDPKPYIAAVFTSSGADRNVFILGDGRKTINPTAQRHGFAVTDYYNGPLEPETSYSISERIILNDKGEYYSTDWSAASKTNEYTGAPNVLTNMSSNDIKAKEGDLVNLLCSAQGEPPITFSWEKDQKPLESFMEKEHPHPSSLLVVAMKNEKSFGKYICHIRDRFLSTTHEISVLEDVCTGDHQQEEKEVSAL